MTKLYSVSDASLQGGGFCVSKGLSPYGHAASLSTVHGDVPRSMISARCCL
jgi:hypothetical protein